MNLSLRDFIGDRDVSRETEDRLEKYFSALERWNAKINLVSKSSMSDSWRRHFLDSAQLWVFKPEHARLWIDFGSGAGFPGLVVAILAHEFQPDLELRLVESDSRKASFLQHVVQTNGLRTKVVIERIESLSPQRADILSARALAPLPDLLAMAEKHRIDTGICLFPKGEAVHKEIADAERLWRFDYRLHPSRTHSEAAIVEIGAIARV